MQVNVLNFDDTYLKQPFLQWKETEWIDLRNVPNTNLFCEKDTLTKIANKLKAYQNTITMIGSGNYHYISYLLLANMQMPFTLVLFDHHTDTLKSPSDSLISCGSWVLEALEKNDNLKKVLIIGVSENGEKHIPSHIEGKVRLYTKHSLRLQFKKALTSILKEIQTEDVYLSIDKDVLDKSEAITAWDHGNMRLRQLLRIVKEIMARKKISGVDICGEYPIGTNEFGRDTKVATEKNSISNQLLLNYIQHWLKQTDSSSDQLHA